MTLEELKKQNTQLSNKKEDKANYIISFYAVYQRPTQKSITLDDTICCELESTKDGKEFLKSIKKYILKEKFKDIREGNLKKLIIFNIYKLGEKNE